MNWKALLFGAYYYIGYGKWVKGIILAVLSSFPPFAIVINIWLAFRANKELPIGQATFQWRNVLAVGIVHVVLAYAISAAMQGGVGGDPALVAIVKNGNIQMCPEYTVDHLAKNFMASPSWEGGVANDGNAYVNLTGGITLQGKPVDALAQFKVDQKAGTFEFNSFELNGIPQNKLIQVELITEMCEAAGK